MQGEEDRGKHRGCTLRMRFLFRKRASRRPPADYGEHKWEGTEIGEYHKEIRCGSLAKECWRGHYEGGKAEADVAQNSI